MREGVPGSERMDGQVDSIAETPTPPLVTVAGPTDGAADLSVADEWDAGDMGCGELVMALRLRMRSLRAGDIVRVTATDPAAPASRQEKGARKGVVAQFESAIVSN
jgi:TusA-related sulfurtransferase